MLFRSSQNNISKVWNSFSVSIISFNKRIQSELEKILESLKNIIAKQNELGLNKIVGGVTLRSPRQTTSCPEKSGVFGRDIDKEAIFKFWQLVMQVAMAFVLCPLWVWVG